MADTTESLNCIVPYRCIPFDIGFDLGEKDIEKIRQTLASYQEIEISRVLRSVSHNISLCFEISEDVRLYIFAPGIGVFWIKDKEFPITDDDYAIEYCQQRKHSHAALLHWEADISPMLRELIDSIRGCLKKHRMRPSAKPVWENGGISYVMTVSSLYHSSEALNCGAEQFDELKQQSLQILLYPEIVHEGDSLVFVDDDWAREFSSSGYPNLNSYEPPHNWSLLPQEGLYISWSAVICTNPQPYLLKLVECFEVSLQAMWLYLYSVTYELENSRDLSLSVSELKKRYYRIAKLYSEFERIEDANVPEPVERARNELIRTSKLGDVYAGLNAFLKECIDEQETIESEKQRHYSVITDICLFVIAYIQILPIVNDWLMGAYNNVDTITGMVELAVAIACIAAIVKK